MLVHLCRSLQHFTLASLQCIVVGRCNDSSLILLLCIYYTDRLVSIHRRPCTVILHTYRLSKASLITRDEGNIRNSQLGSIDRCVCRYVACANVCTYTRTRNYIDTLLLQYCVLQYCYICCKCYVLLDTFAFAVMCY